MSTRDQIRGWTPVCTEERSYAHAYAWSDHDVFALKSISEKGSQTEGHTVAINGNVGRVPDLKTVVTSVADVYTNNGYDMSNAFAPNVRGGLKAIITNKETWEAQDESGIVKQFPISASITLTVPKALLAFKGNESFDTTTLQDLRHDVCQELGDNMFQLQNLLFRGIVDPDKINDVGPGH